MTSRQLSLSEILERSIDRAGRHADQDWTEAALEKVAAVARHLEEFTTDDLWDAGLDETRENRALGAVMRRAASQKWITKTDRVTVSRRHKRNHGQRGASGKSNLFGGRHA